MSKDLSEKFLEAVSEFELEELRKLLDEGADVNERDEMERTVLHYIFQQVGEGEEAEEEGEIEEKRERQRKMQSVEVLNWLVSKGGDLNLKDQSGRSSFYYAFRKGDQQVIDFLEKHTKNRGGDVLKGYLQNEKLEEKRLNEYLEEIGEEGVKYEEEEECPLSLLCRNPKVSLSLVKKVLWKEDKEIGNSMVAICENKNSESEEILPCFLFLEGMLKKEESDLSTQRSLLSQMLTAACNTNKNSVIAHLLKDKLGREELRKKCFEIVCSKGNKVAVEEYIKNGGDTNDRDKFSKSLLDYSCEEKKVEIVSFLLEKGSDPNLTDRDGNTPLLALSQENFSDEQIQICRLLLASKANPSYVNTEEEENDGNSPLHFAVLNSNPKLVSLLVSYGANKNLQNSNVSLLFWFFTLPN